MKETPHVGTRIEHRDDLRVERVGFQGAVRVGDECVGDGGPEVDPRREHRRVDEAEVDLGA